MNLYSSEIKNYIYSRPWPKGLRIEIVQRSAEGFPYLQFVLFRHNFNSFDRADQEQIARTVDETLSKINNDGIPMRLQVSGDG